MRNLKRALSLALASVMLLGMMVVGTSAAYDDVSSKENQEAIEVLQAVGIMTGDENGNFNPSAGVTRNEMAVVMSNLMKYNVANYAGTSPFTDVPEWAEPYVAACYTNGITSGTGANTYGGNDPVTTAQAALMLLKTLGYFQYQSDFGDDWQLETIKRGNRVELFTGVDTAAYQALTRNDLAQLVLNALQSGMVEADAGTTVSGNGITITTNVTYNYIASSLPYAGAISGETPASSTSATAGAIVELGEKLYEGDLKLRSYDEDNERDVYGRPANTWYLKSEEIGSYAALEPLATYTAKASKGALWSLIGKSNYDNLGTSANLLVTFDGNPVANSAAKANYFLSNSTGAANNSGNGTLTEVYMDNDGNVTVVTIATYLAQANGDYKESSGTLNTVTLTNPGTFNVGALDVEEFENLPEFKDDDYILYTVSYDGTRYSVESIAKAEVLSGTVNAYATGKSGSVTIEGTAYKYNEYAEANTDNGYGVTYNVGEAASVVLDAYGYVIYVDDASLSLGNYLYVDGVISATGFSGDYQANAYFPDGTKKVINIDKLYATKTATTATPLTAGTTPVDTYDGFYSYSVSDNEYTLRKASDTSTLVTDFTTAGPVINSESVKFLEGYAAVKGDDNTVFVVYDNDETVTLYTGINNVPDISLTAAGTIKVSYMKDKDDATKNVSFVWVDASHANARIDSAANENVLFVLNLDSTYVDKANGDKIQRFNAILNGELTQIDAKEVTGLSIYTMYYKYSQDSNGYYKADAFTTASTVDYAWGSMAEGSNHEITYSNGVISLGGQTYSITSDTEIVLVLTDVGTTPSTSGNVKANDAEMKKIMVDPDGKYETQIGLTGKGLENAVKGYYVTGTYYGVRADDNSDSLTKLYVNVASATVKP